jgi:manganese oxidase
MARPTTRTGRVHQHTIPALAAALVLTSGAPADGGQPSFPVAGFEDFTRPVGATTGGVYRVELTAMAVLWQPWGPDGTTLLVHTFAADGAAPRVPAPLMRVNAGTPVEVAVRNTFDWPLVLRGLHDNARFAGPQRRPGTPPDDSVVVAAGATAVVRFTATLPGTFVFRGLARGPMTAPDGVLYSSAGAERSFIGLLIVDPPETTPVHDERFFLITHWVDPAQPATFLPATRFFINGRSWPHTERLTVEQHDTVRWRVINFSGRPHPMHLHGFYFNVDARGDLVEETVYAPAERRLVVTEVLAPAQSMRMSWVAHEPGNWVFHCHLMRHMSSMQTTSLADIAHGDHGASQADHVGSDGEMMGGLVLGVTVRPAADWRPDAGGGRRRLQLHITLRAGLFGDEPGYSFVLQRDQLPAADSVHFPGSLLELHRGERTEIVVRNRADVALGVHWHGIELESRSDGVPGWSGLPGSAVAAIAPGDSLLVRMTPPREGTFMYHVHSEPGHQLAGGLYGTLLVTEPSAPHDPARDLAFLLGSLGTGDDPPPAINGMHRPPPLELRSGETYRLRFMHISPDDEKRVTLLDGEGAVRWQRHAKDGAMLPAQQRAESPAEFTIHVGETYDFLWSPRAAGDYTLRVTTIFDRGAPLFPRNAPAPDVTDIRIRVR